MAKVWFITGSSKGFGRVWAEAALERGDRVAATARDPAALEALSRQYGDRVATLKLDVTNKSEVDAAIGEAQRRFGRLDVVINNAGYGLFGAIEEISEAQARAQMETNLFGALWVTQAALPIMRSQRSGHIIQVSSVGGLNAFANIGLYHASKWALEGFSQTLALEVADMGIHVTLVEPTAFATDWRGPSSSSAKPLEPYEHVRALMATKRGNNIPGDPKATGPVILAIVDAEKPPLRVLFGDRGLPMMRQEYAKRLAEWEAWDHLSVMAQGPNRNRKD